MQSRKQKQKVSLSSDNVAAAAAAPPGPPPHCAAPPRGPPRLLRRPRLLPPHRRLLRQVLPALPPDHPGHRHRQADLHPHHRRRHPPRLLPRLHRHRLRRLHPPLRRAPRPAPERDADINLSLPGDAFDLVVRAKTALELACPGTVSCSDILVVAARDLVTMLGGPYYDVALGRRDTRISRASLVAGLLPRPNMTVSDLLSLFASRGFSAQEMVALAGAHTVGLSHCKEFSSGIYGFSKSSAFDPSYNPRFAQGLQRACASYGKDPTLSVFNDVMTPNKFDNMYYQNLPKGLGLLASDRGLYGDPRTRPFVEMYAKDQDRFFRDFARAIQKLSLYGVQTGRRGEIRRRCDAVN
ncbi:hypothetical protein NL676_006129 [Syzygium grande]|nr:hypothetical protein NL676_006129 [Syzygium grande]